MSNLLSLRAYARHRKAAGLPGATLGAVQKAIDSKRITPIDGKIDAEVADIQWSRNTDPDQQQRGNGGQLVQALVHAAPPASDQERAPRDPKFMDAKTRSETARAELFELELAEKRGELVNREEVRRHIFEKARIARDAMMSLPARLSATLAAETDQAKCHDMLMVEVRKICEEIAAGEKQSQH